MSERTPTDPEPEPTLATVLAEMRAGFAGMSSRMEAMDDRLSGRLDDVTRTMDRVEARSDTLVRLVQQIAVRTTAIEHNTAMVPVSIANQNSRIDDFEMRLTLIERRLEIREG